MKNICVFGSSSEIIDREYLDVAEQLGAQLAYRDYHVIFGAGRYGVMGAVARGVIHIELRAALEGRWPNVSKVG